MFYANNPKITPTKKAAPDGTAFFNIMICRLFLCTSSRCVHDLQCRTLAKLLLNVSDNTHSGLFISPDSYCHE